MADAAFRVNDDLHDHRALDPRLAGLGRIPPHRLTDELGALGGPSHPQSVLLEPRLILREVGAGQAEDLAGRVPLGRRMIFVQEPPRGIDGPVQYLLLGRIGPLQGRSRLEHDLLELLRSLYEPALGERLLDSIEAGLGMKSRTGQDEQRGPEPKQDAPGQCGSLVGPRTRATAASTEIDIPA